MYMVSFSAPKLVEFTDPSLFQHKVGTWMEIREAENSYLLARLPGVVTQARQSGLMRERLFALQDGDQIMAAAMLFPEGCLLHTWASPAMIDAITEGLMRGNCRVTSTLGPAHASGQLAEKFAQRTRQRFETGRSERIYQLTRVSYVPPATGRLELALESDRDMLLPWLLGFISEADFELSATTPVELLATLIRERALYVWKESRAVSMAGWAAPTPHGASINFVYTPPEFRRHGYAKAAVSALAARMLASGLSYCFILTGTDDDRTNKLYQAIGARTLCELLRCTIQSGVSISPGGYMASAAHSNVTMMAR